MRNKRHILTGILLICTLSFFGFNELQDCEKLTRVQLRAMLVQLGYEVKDIVKEEGKEKYEVKLTKNGLDIPTGIEISPSGNIIWLTVNLGAPKAETSAINYALLKQNSKIQPCQFYATESGRLMMGLPIENRGVSNALLREKVESITSRVGETKDIWQAP